MKLKSLLILPLLILSQSGQAGDFNRFVKACGFGALIGAGVGLASLAAENKPSEHYANIPRGASLGLYAGIAYGAYLAAPPPKNQMRQDIEFSSATMVVPTFAQNKVDGVSVSSNVYSF